MRSAAVELRNVLVTAIVKAMRLNVTDPTTGVVLFMEAKPDRLHNEQGYRITSPNGSTFFVSNRLGAWRAEDSHPIDPLLLANIGIAIEAREQEEIRPASPL